MVIGNQCVSPSRYRWQSCKNRPWRKERINRAKGHRYREPWSSSHSSPKSRPLPHSLPKYTVDPSPGPAGPGRAQLPSAEEFINAYFFREVLTPSGYLRNGAPRLAVTRLEVFFAAQLRRGREPRGGEGRSGAAPVGRPPLPRPGHTGPGTGRAPLRPAPCSFSRRYCRSSLFHQTTDAASNANIAISLLN